MRDLQSSQWVVCGKVAVETQQVSLDPSLVPGWGLLSHHGVEVAA